MSNLAIDTNYICAACNNVVDVAIISHTENVYIVSVEPCQYCLHKAEDDGWNKAQKDSAD